MGKTVSSSALTSGADDSADDGDVSGNGGENGDGDVEGIAIGESCGSDSDHERAGIADSSESGDGSDDTASRVGSGVGLPGRSGRRRSSTASLLKRRSKRKLSASQPSGAGANGGAGLVDGDCESSSLNLSLSDGGDDGFFDATGFPNGVEMTKRPPSGLP